MSAIANAQLQNGAMVSEVSICNQALLWLGQKIIISFNDRSTTAEWCRNNYPFIRDALLESNMWRFATRRAQSTVADRDEWGVEYSHPIPDNWLSVLRVYTNVDTQDPVQAEWQLENGRVLTPESMIYLYGVIRVTDTRKFSQLFCQALAARLAADAAIPLTSNRLLQADMWALYDKKMEEAETMDGRQGRSERARARYLQRAR